MWCAQPAAAGISPSAHAWHTKPRGPQAPRTLRKRATGTRSERSVLPSLTKQTFKEKSYWRFWEWWRQSVKAEAPSEHRSLRWRRAGPGILPVTPLPSAFALPGNQRGQCLAILSQCPKSYEEGLNGRACHSSFQATDVYSTIVRQALF